MNCEAKQFPVSRFVVAGAGVNISLWVTRAVEFGCRLGQGYGKSALTK